MNDEQLQRDMEMVDRHVSAFGVLPLPAQQAWQRLRARIAELEVDAGRWRALFDCGLPVTILGTDCYTKAEADAAIDAAREAK